VWGGNPRPKTLTECSVCHLQAQVGNYTMRKFTVTDEAFRGHLQ
jgi:heterodisulfide reductase subunit B